MGEERGFRLQGKYVQKWSLTHPTHTHTLKQPETFGKTSGATMFSQLYHKQLLNTLLPLILHCLRHPPCSVQEAQLWSHVLLLLWLGLGL